MIKLLVLDGDHTLWEPLDGVNCSDCTPDDAVGNPDFGYAPVEVSPDMVRRDDGARFLLTPGARALIEKLHKRGMRLAVASYNHAGNIERILAAFGLRKMFSQVVASWNTDKATMLRAILEAEDLAGHGVSPGEVLFVDDDPESIYRGQAAGLGVHFAKMGPDGEVTGWRDVERLVRELSEQTASARR